MMKMKTGKDFWAGIMFLGFAAAGLYAARGYSLGSAGKMGPGYFPIMLGIALGAIGFLLVARAIISGDEHIGNFNLRPLLMLVLGVVIFGLAIQPLGLVATLIITVAIAALAGRQSGPVEVGVLAVSLVALSIGIFHFALRLPLPIWPSL
jgi:hypothetical protein